MILKYTGSNNSKRQITVIELVLLRIVLGINGVIKLSYILLFEPNPLFVQNMFSTGIDTNPHLESTVI